MAYNRHHCRRRVILLAHVPKYRNLTRRRKMLKFLPAHNEEPSLIIIEFPSVQLRECKDFFLNWEPSLERHSAKKQQKKLYSVGNV